jgi:2-keto-3-deoxy-galactonokinase
MSLFEFGQGNVLVCALEHSNGGIVVVQYAETPGTPEDVGKAVDKLSDVNLLIDTVMIFPTIDQALRVANALIGKEVYDV